MALRGETLVESVYPSNSVRALRCVTLCSIRNALHAAVSALHVISISTVRHVCITRLCASEAGGCNLPPSGKRPHAGNVANWELNLTSDSEILKPGFHYPS